MAKKRNKVRSGPSSPVAVSSTVIQPSNYAQELKEAEATAVAEHDEALDAALLEGLTPEEVTRIEAEALPASSKLKDTLAHSARAAALYRAAKTELDKREQQLLERERQVADKGAQLAAKFAPLQQLERELNERLEDVLRREQEAQGGFQRLRRELLEEMDRQLGDERRQLKEQREKQEEEDRRLRELLLTVNRAAKDARDRAQELDDEAERLNAKVERRVEKARARLDEELTLVRDELDQVKASRDSLQREVGEHRQRHRQLGHLSVEGLQSSLQEAQKRVAELEAELSSRPDSAFMTRFQHLSRENTRLVSENARLTGEVTQYMEDLSRINGERERLVTVKRERDILQQRSDLLGVQLDQLKDEIQAFRSVSGDRPVFPAFITMDRDPVLNTPLKVKKAGNLTLPTLVNELRVRMASLPDRKDRRSYSESVVRLFLGGLAMSRLHLLLGISGTGKTSLPRAAAQALGWHAPVVEVQAGWTDRTDLIGHYNAFEKRYYETEFLKALYTARTPARSDVPHLIVLDEMNLSHTEQYFADFLSLIERKPGDRPLAVTPNAFDQVPDGLRRGKSDGLYLEIPDNVWFIGTANKDETTKTFADKTFDRSHVLELPRQRDLLEPVDQLEEFHIGHGQLQALFAQAVDEHGDRGEEAYRKLEEGFGPELMRNFGIGWGGRLKDQLSLFVPVVVGAGGTVGEAFDHVLATRLLRKLEGRFDTNPEHLKALLTSLEGNWFKDGSLPLQSVEVVTAVLREREADV